MIRRNVLWVSLAACLITASAARADLLAPGQSFAGMSQAEWSVVWWQKMLAIPVTQNPITDTTGANASPGNQGSVYFLAGSTGPEPVVRNVKVGSNQILFAPLINFVTWAEISAYGGGEANLRRDLAEGAGISPTGGAPNTFLFASLNGTDLASSADLLAHRQQSPAGLFDAVLPADALFGQPPGTYPAAADGWYIALGSLAPGTYELHIGGMTEGYGAYEGFSFEQDITYHLTVQAVPEPSGLLLLGSAGLLLLGRRVRAGVRRAAVAS